MLEKIWDSAIVLAVVGLVLFVWFELSDDIQNNAAAIAEIRVGIANTRADLVDEIAGTRAEMSEKFAEVVALMADMNSKLADLRTEVIRETHTNREGLFRLEGRIRMIEGENP